MQQLEQLLEQYAATGEKSKDYVKLNRLSYYRTGLEETGCSGVRLRKLHGATGECSFQIWSSYNRQYSKYIQLYNGEQQLPAVLH